MDRSSVVSVGFAEEVQILISVAVKLGDCYRAGDREEFVRSLQAMGFSDQEADDFWQGLVSAPSANGGAVELRTVRSNTELAERFGLLLDSTHYPRNLLVYRLLQQHFPDFFAVAVSGKRHMGGKASRGNPPDRRVVRFPKQPARETSKEGRVDALAVYKVFQGAKPSQFSERVLRVAEPLRHSLDDELGLKMTETLLGCKMLIPSLRMSEALAKVIRAGQAGELVTLAGVFCPDYAYEETGDPIIPYRYTFDGVGEGVGLVALQFARIVPQVSRFLTEIGVRHKFVLGIADFEADSEKILAQVRLDHAEFLRRCRVSLEAFRNAVPCEVPLELEMFDEKRGNGRRRQYAEEATAAMTGGNFGLMAEMHPDLQEVLERIPGQYCTFYERWYGHDMEDLEVRQIVYQQGGEYAAVARVLWEDFGDNVILLTGDRPEMNRFNSFFNLLPTLCAKRAY